MKANPFILCSQSSTLDSLAHSLSRAKSHGAAGVMILACSGNQYHEPSLNELLKSYSLPIFGGLFPQIVNDTNVFSEGFIVLGLDVAPVVHNYTELSKAECFRHYIEVYSREVNQCRNFIMITDAFCSANEDFIDQFYGYIGSGVNVIGGGAGSLDFVQRPCIFTSEGLVDDAVQVVALSDSLTRAIGHGWEIFDGPYLVTESEGHLVKTLDYRPAFELYQEAIKVLSGQEICEATFFNVAKDFPLGISGLNDEILVRDPIKTEHGCLECVGNVPVNSMVYLLSGNQQHMIDSAGVAARSLANNNAEVFLLFDCISRGLYMGKDFVEELTAIKNGANSRPLIGVLSLGEVANIKSGAIHLLNKSTVIGAF